jgi:hypothetical protein
MMKLRQAVFVASELEENARKLTDTLGIEIAHRDPAVGKWGLANVVCPAGGDFVEIVTPIKEGTSAGRYIERRKGDGGYMVILQTPDAVAHRDRILGMGVRAVAQRDTPEYRYTHFHPSDVGGVLLSLDSAHAPAGENQAEWWPPVGPGWQKHRGSGRIAGLASVELQSSDPVALATRWGELLGRPARRDGAHLSIALDGGEIRFVEAKDARGPGISAYDMRCVDKPAVLAAAKRNGLTHGDDYVVICGCRINLI